MQLLATPGLFTIEVDREPSDGRMFELELLGRAMHEVLNGQIDGYNVADRFAGTALEWSGDVPKKLGVDTTAFDAAGTGEAAATAAVSAHVAAGDPHTGYQLEVEKDAASGYAGLDVNARLLSTRLQLTATAGLESSSTQRYSVGGPTSGVRSQPGATTASTAATRHARSLLTGRPPGGAGRGGFAPRPGGRPRRPSWDLARRRR